MLIFYVFLYIIHQKDLGCAGIGTLLEEVENEENDEEVGKIN